MTGNNSKAPSTTEVIVPSNSLSPSADLELQPIPTSASPTLSNAVDVLPATPSASQWRRTSIIFAATCCTFTGCGLNFAFGCYQEHYESVDGPFGGQVAAAKVDLIGTLAVSLMTIFAPWTSYWTAKYGPSRVTLLGAVLFSLGMIIAGSCTSLWQFLLTQGVTVGLGTCLSYIPAVTVSPGWFDRNRALAMGIVLSGTGLGGLVWSPLTNVMIQNLGFRNALRITGSVGFVLIALAALLLDWAPGFRPGQDGRPRRGGMQLVNWRVARGKLFGIKSGTAVLQAAGYYFPLYFIASYAYKVGLTKQQGANLLGLSNGLSALGKIVLGALADRYGRLNMLCFCCIVSAAGVLALWMPSAALPGQETTPLFYGFVVVYGLTAGGYVSLFPTILVELFGVQHFASINGLLYCLRGLGTLVGTPLTSLLLRGYAGQGALADVAGIPGGSGYVESIALNGAVLGAASVGAAWLRVEIARRDGWKWKM
ncbi:MFS general substrate transporter [Dacryopinax primogenitus]|uniref:MFS general substrate transporter n=1 Tax=Dacryopinax primogenitus (strain DJM 731) TaxID=1858805 RepID=M5G916_DACPD|nr:MFS general substrate transporter [Dacryopinax primogenitus]EJU04675.1 MFS general substrate transporter [Dacryopinax primogenitus]